MASLKELFNPNGKLIPELQSILDNCFTVSNEAQAWCPHRYWISVVRIIATDSKNPSITGGSTYLKEKLVGKAIHKVKSVPGYELAVKDKELWVIIDLSKRPHDTFAWFLDIPGLYVVQVDLKDAQEWLFKQRNLNNIFRGMGGLCIYRFR
jgi:hypothetical protein